MLLTLLIKTQAITRPRSLTVATSVMKITTKGGSRTSASKTAKLPTLTSKSSCAKRKATNTFLFKSMRKADMRTESKTSL